MDIRRGIRCIVMLAVLVWCGGARATNLLNLKDTLTVLPDELHVLSLLHGAIAWHSGAIMNMYDHGVSESSIESPIINIVRKLFHRVPDTTSSIDFQVAGNEKSTFNKNNELYIKNMVQRLVALWHRAIIEPHIKFKGELDVKILSDYNTNLKNILCLPKSIIEEDFFFGSSQDQIRAEIVIRLACLWALIGHDRILIKTYYQCLKSMLENMKPILEKSLMIIKFVKQDMIASWDGDAIVFGNKGFESKADIQSYLLQSNINPTALLEAFSCLSLFKELIPMPYKHICYKDNYEYEYANCSDTVVLNIINYITFGSDGACNVSVIEDILGKGHKVHKSLCQFYEVNPFPLMHNKDEVHKAWGKIVSNLDYVEYAHAVGDSGLLNRVTEKGFIKLPHGVDSQRFIAEGFTVVDANVECFEVRSTAHNLIVILDHILHLQLFNKKSLHQEYFSPHFVAIYIPKVFEKIGKIEFIRNNEHNVSFSLNLHDRLKRKVGHAYAMLTISFNIRKHGQFSVDEISQNMDISKVMNIFNLKPFYSLLFVIPVDTWFSVFPEINESFALYLWPHFNVADIVSNILYQNNLYKRGINFQEYILLEKIVALHADQNIGLDYLKILEFLWILISDRSPEKQEQLFSKALEAMSVAVVENSGIGIVLFEVLFERAKIQYQEMQPQVLTRVLQVVQDAEQNVDRSVRESGLIFFRGVLQKLIETFKSWALGPVAFEVAQAAVHHKVLDIQELGLKLFEVLVQQDGIGEYMFKEASIAAEVAVCSNDRTVQRKGFELFKTLFERGQGFDQAIKLAEVAVHSTDRTMQFKGFELFEELFERGQGFNQAIKLAEVAVHSTDRTVQRKGFELFKALFERGQGFNQAIEVAEVAVHSTDRTMQFKGFELFEALVKKGQGFDQAIEVAGVAVDSNDRMVRIKGFELFEALVKKGQGFDQAIEIAGNAVASSDSAMQVEGIMLFEELIKKGQGLDQVIKVAKVAVNNSNWEVRDGGFRLFKALVAKGQGFDQVIKVAEVAVNSSDRVMRYEGIKLFKEFFERGQGFDQAINGAKVAINSVNGAVQSQGFELFKELFERGQGFDHVIELAKVVVNSSDRAVQSQGVDLFKKLVERGQGFAQAIEMAKVAVNSSDRAVHFKGIELFKTLFEKGKGFDKAIEVAGFAVKSNDRDVRLGGIGLFKALVEKGQGFNQAIEVAKVAVNSFFRMERDEGFGLFEELVNKGQNFD